MTSYQRRLQEIKALKERVAQLEALLSPAEVRQLDQDYINKRRTQQMLSGVFYSGKRGTGMSDAVLKQPQWAINAYPEVSGLKTTPGTRKLTKWEMFLLFFRQPRFVWKAWRHKT